MTLNQFIKEYDKDNSIILLEGKRKVPDTDIEKLIKLGKLLTIKSKKMIFRSGNAEGADHYFSLGIASVDAKRFHAITPYNEHRQKLNRGYEIFSLDDINLAAEPEVVYQSKTNKKTEKLIDRYISGNKDRFSIKAAYIIRDTIKVIGADKIPQATFGIFYDDLNNPGKGGTGHTMNVCKLNNIPVIDQNVWFEWLK